ncbi:MAG: hypothetical protein HFI76_08815 [Lachnospiraceae bacterium]|nr:hypothetical protein [Lachnospiraceae bacterium]
MMQPCSPRLCRECKVPLIKRRLRNKKEDAGVDGAGFAPYDRGNYG